MLHMVVNTHDAESCAFRGVEEERILSTAIERFRESAPSMELALQGTWVSRAAHEIFMLVDAPNAHVIEDALLGAGMVGRTHSRILPVMSVVEAMDFDDASR